MPSFRYEALTSTGAIVSGKMSGTSGPAVIRQLQDAGHLPVRVAPDDGGRLHEFLSRDLFGKRRLSHRELGVATQELATLIKAGVALDRALEMLVGLAESKHARKLFGAVLERVRSGSGLADALAAHGNAFPPLYANMVRAGELGGALDVTLMRLADFLAKSRAARESVKSALIYPIMLVIVAALSLLVVLTVVLPQFKPLFHEAGASLPTSTQILMTAGDIAGRFWWLGIALLVAAVVGFRRALSVPAFERRWHRLLLCIPLLRDLVTKTDTARFCRTLGTLATNGVPLATAVSLARHTLGNRVLAEAVDGAATRLKEGEGLSAPLTQTAVFPNLATHLMRVGEESGQLEAMLLRVADIFDDEVKHATDRLLAVMTPALTIGLGAAIAGIIMSILAALISVNNLAV